MCKEHIVSLGEVLLAQFFLLEKKLRLWEAPVENNLAQTVFCGNNLLILLIHTVVAVHQLRHRSGGVSCFVV